MTDSLLWAGQYDLTSMPKKSPVTGGMPGFPVCLGYDLVDFQYASGTTWRMPLV